MFVIFKNLLGYAVTDLENYNSPAMDYRKVFQMKDFEDIESIKSYFITYCKCSENDFIVKI